jgi:transposase
MCDHTQRPHIWKQAIRSKISEENTCNRELYKRRNEVERLFRKLKGFRRIFTRFEKLDLMFTAFLHLALAYLIL